jgi:hypothetical protein
MADEISGVDWSDDAKRLLGLRDRFTRDKIMHEFEENPGKDAVLLDPDQKWYATPVANNRYAVIWVQKETVADVRVVVASQLKGESAADLKDKLEKVVEFETKGVLKRLF